MMYTECGFIDTFFLFFFFSFLCVLCVCVECLYACVYVRGYVEEREKVLRENKGIDEY